MNFLKQIARLILNALVQLTVEHIIELENNKDTCYKRTTNEALHKVTNDISTSNTNRRIFILLIFDNGS